MPQPHLAIVCSQHAPGDNRIFSRLTCGFAKLGWRVSLIAPARGPVPAMPSGAEFVELEYVGGYLNRLRRAGRVLPVLERLKPDVVLFPDPDLMQVMLSYCRRSGAVVVFDRHENFEKAEAYHARGWLERTAARLYAAYERYAAPRLDGVVVVFEEMRQALPRRTQVCVAHNYPTRAVLEELAAGPAAGVPSYTSVFVGTFRAVHGTHAMLELAHELVNQRGCREFTLYVAGQFDPGLAEQAQQYIAEHKLSANVTLEPKRLPHQDVVRLVAASRIGLCPLSRQVSNQPYLQNKLLEFMAAGVPVIASDTGPGGRVVRAAQCGELFWAEDVPAMADVVARWLAAPEAAQQLGRRGQEYVMRNLVWEHELDQLAKWLLRLPEQRARRS